VQLRIALEKGGLSWTRDWYEVMSVNVEAPGGVREDFIVLHRLEDSKGELQPHLAHNDPTSARPGRAK